MSRRLYSMLFLVLLIGILPGLKTSSRAVVVVTPHCIPDTAPGVPVLLVEESTIPESTLYFLEDYQPDTVYLMGEVESHIQSQLSQYGTVVTLKVDDSDMLPRNNLTLSNYVVISDIQDPLYPAARLLASYRGSPLVYVPDDLKDIVQKEWKFMQWEFVSSLWGVWEYAMWDRTEDKLQWIGYRYLFTDALFETHSFRMAMEDRIYNFLPENTVYVAIVGDIGTSMEYWREELLKHHILVPTVASECDPRDYQCYRCDYSPFHEKYVAFSSVECLAPVEELNDVLFQDAPKYWVSSEKEREDLIAMASFYTDIIPSPEVPLSLDSILAEKYAVGRITGYDLADAMAFIARALFLPPQSETYLLANNIEVPVYTDVVLELLEKAGIEGAYYPLGEAEANVMKEFTGIVIYNGTGNSSFFLPHFYKKGEGVVTDLNVEVEGIDSHMFVFYPGNGCISFWFPDITNKYDIKISEGFSKKTWEFTAARPELFVLVNDLKGEKTDLRETELDAIVQESIPSIDHFKSPFAYISATGPIGSSEFPLWFISKGASGFCINVGMQEVLTNFEFEALFFSHALANNSVGEAMLYAKNTVHTAGYWYPLSGLWMSEEQHVREEASCLFGDPALNLNLLHPLKSVIPLQELLADPLVEAQTLQEELQSIQEKCSELGIEIEGLDEAIAESEKRINEKDPQALEFVQKEYERTNDTLRYRCQSELEESEKRAQDPESEGILTLARRAYDEGRYTDCLVLCSQIERGNSSLVIIIITGAVVGLIFLVVVLYFVRR